MFGYASEQHSVEPATTVSRDYDKIDIAFLRFAADSVDGITRPDFHRAFSIAQKVEFAECFHVQTRILQVDTMHTRKIRAEAIDHHRGRQLNGMKQTQLCAEDLAQECGIHRTSHAALGEINRGKNLSNTKFFPGRNESKIDSSFPFSLTNDQDRTGREPDNPLGRASEDNSFQASIAARRQHDEIDLEFARQVTDFLIGVAGANMAVLRPESRPLFGLYFRKFFAHKSD
jgi:hypothetical protein